MGASLLMRTWDLRRGEVGRPYRVVVPVDGWEMLDLDRRKMGLEGVVVVERWVKERSFAGMLVLGYQSLGLEAWEGDC